MKLSRYSQWIFLSALGIGAAVAILLCVQCVRTYLYTDAVLVPQQAEHEAARETGALAAAARSAGIADPRALGPLLEHAMESGSDRILSMRVLDRDGTVRAARGNPQPIVTFPSHWWNPVGKHDRLGTVISTQGGPALRVMLPLRIARAPHTLETVPSDRLKNLDPGVPKRSMTALDSHDDRPDDRHPAYVLEAVISLNAVAGTFEGLQQNLIIGVVASLALLLSVAVIGLRAPHYFRGRYLESELQLARRVQSDLQPKPQSGSVCLDFAALAIAADHVGGDFHDIFEAEPGKIAIVLGDVSGKGVPAALLVSVLQGAIRSATGSAHELPVKRINEMLCERTACERFATLFWAVFDPALRTLHYVNAGHPAPMLIRRPQNRVERLNEGGPVLGLIPDAHYSAGVIHVSELDTLLLYSDGITEAASGNEEFGEARVQAILTNSAVEAPEQLCRNIMRRITNFGNGDTAQDDRTLMVVNFRISEPASGDWERDDVGAAATSCVGD